MKKCDHWWTYEHVIYQSRQNTKNGIAVHRQCSRCGVHELTKIHNPKWTRDTRGFSLTDMRKGKQP
jgi:hypothetical protein